MMIDTYLNPNVSRDEVRKEIDRLLNEPIDPEGKKEYADDQWARFQAEAMAKRGDIDAAPALGKRGG